MRTSFKLSKFTTSTLLLRRHGCCCRRRPMAGSRSLSTGNSSSSSIVRLPIVDLSLEDELAVGKALHEACTTFGFFYLTNHGISPSLQHDVLQQARTFFEIDLHQKEAISAEHSTSFRGYQRLHVNQTQGKSDYHEGLDIFSESMRGKLANKPSNHGINQWPDPTKFPKFQSTILEYTNQMQSVGDQLMRACALGLGLQDDNYFDPYFKDPFWNMRLIYYPPQTQEKKKEEEEEEELGVGEHTDYGIFTMILAEQETSHNTLQVRSSSSNEWVFVETLPNTMICNVADMLSTWTNGIYKSTSHRVLPPQHPSGRISVPFFFDPSYDAIIKPIPLLVKQSNQPPNFKPIRYGDHLFAKTSRNFVFK